MTIIFKEVCDMAPVKQKSNKATVLKLILSIILKETLKAKNKKSIYLQLIL